MKKENNKNIILIVFIVIAIIIGITMGIIMAKAKVRKENNKDNKNITTISYETEMQSVIIAEVEESKKK